MLYDHLGKRAKTPRKQHRSFYLKSVPKGRSYEPYSTECTFCLEIRALFPTVQNLKSIQYDLFCWTVLCLDFCSCSSCCTTCSIRTVRPAFNVVLVASISVLVRCLGMHALALRNGCSLVARKCSLSCSLKNDATSQEWLRHLALIDLMREGEGFSNLTVEIRLDGWLRFGVSSLTLTLVIKSPFNLHLTN
jgi:hypothetical protein